MVPNKLCDFCERMTSIPTLLPATILYDWYYPGISMPSTWYAGIEDASTARLQAIDEQEFRRRWPTERIVDFLSKQSYNFYPTSTSQILLHRSLQNLCSPEVRANCHLCYQIHNTIMRDINKSWTAEDIVSIFEHELIFLLPLIGEDFGAIDFMLLADQWPSSRCQYTLGLKESSATIQPGPDLRAGTIQRLRTWLHECQNRHAVCIRKRDMFQRRLPSRLVEIDFVGDEPQVRLVETQDMHSPPEYAALSHCWGPKGLRVMLLERNEREWLTKIPYSELPGTFQEAIAFTRSLQVRYIWIDALCIIQDSEADWEKEACQMASVYSGSHFTIAATASTSGDGGLFVQNYYETPCLVRPHWSASGSHPSTKSLLAGHRVDEPYKQWVVEGSLNQRGWVYQERLLSLRTIHFTGAQIFWDCDSNGGQELSIRDEPLEITTENTYETLSAKDALRDKQWLRLVELYSRTALTKLADRLMALSGVAEAFAQLHGYRAEDYLAGLWRQDIETQLLWAADGCAATAPPALTSYLAPSWSWVSAAGPVEWPCEALWARDHRKEWFPDFEIQSAVVKLRRDNYFGALEGGHLRVCSRVLLEFTPGEYGIYTSRAGDEVVRADRFFCSCGQQWTSCPAFQAKKAVLLPAVVVFTHIYFLVLVKIGKGTYRRLPQMIMLHADNNENVAWWRQVTNELEEPMYTDQLPDGRYEIVII